MKISECIKIDSPTNCQLQSIINKTMPNLFKYDFSRNPNCANFSIDSG